MPMAAGLSDHVWNLEESFFWHGEEIPMKAVDSYRLVAYDTESSKVAFDLPSYAGTHGLSAGIVLTQDEIDWKIIGVRKDSTPEVQRIDVKKVSCGTERPR
jgi:hypothetical protein